MSKNELPVIDLGTPGERDCWESICGYIKIALEVFGAVCLVVALAAGAGYWWARHGEPQWIKAAKAEVQRVVQPDCGSCRKGGAK